MVDDYTQIGKIAKAFGTRGQLRLNIESRFLTDALSKDVYFVDVKGDIVPYFIEHIDKEKLLVKFEEVENPEDAKQIAGGALYLKSKDISIDDRQDQDIYQQLRGFLITNKDQLIGEIKSIEEFPQQIMAIVFINDTDKTILIPLNEKFIVNINPDDKSLAMDLPIGLIESQLD